MHTLLSRTVVFHQGGREPPCNGSVEHAAVVTRVWGDGPRPTVNLFVMFDCAPAACRSSVPHQSIAVPGAACWRYADEAAGA